MICYTCKQEITEPEYVEFLQHKDNEIVGLSTLHMVCYNTIVQYLQDARLEWENAFQTAPRGRSQVPEPST